MNYQQYYGIYYFLGLVLNIESSQGRLIATIPGVPVGYEVLLEPVGDDLFRNIGGPIDGSTLTFIRNESGEVNGMQIGTYELTKINQEALENLPITERLPEPLYELNPRKQAQFQELLDACMSQADGAWIDYDLPYPVHEFVQFITAQDQIIFHGTNNMQIGEFKPTRKSMELRDETGRGNIQAVYGTHDGLWAMFFAVMDREQLQGSIRNGVMYFQNRKGEEIAVYNFSINQDQLEQQPYTVGALYLLPKTTFSRLKLTPESYANEWASEQPVKPIAKLKIQPKDFPFLEQISGHDDRELIRLNKMSSQIREAATNAVLEADQFEVTLPKDSEIVTELDEYMKLQRIMMPAARFEAQIFNDQVNLIVTNLPSAVRQMLSDQYQDLLE